MYIHIGGDRMIRSAELIAIFDISIEQSSKISSQYMQYNKEHNRVETAGEEEVKSIVVTRDQIFYSPISSSTLKKRLYQII
jgi:hypothetical protein